MPMLADPTETLEAIRKQRENLEWISTSIASLREKHGGRYIAVKDGQVVDFDKDFEVLLGRVRKLADSEAVTIEFITELEYLWLL
jgi:hypothetical protein